MKAAVATGTSDGITAAIKLAITAPMGAKMGAVS